MVNESMFIYTPAAHARIQDQMRLAPTAGAWLGAESAARHAPIAGDPDACLKLLKAVQPHGLEKSDVPADAKPTPVHKVEGTTEAISGPHDVTRMIKAAMVSPSAIEDLERGYGGREQAALAKAAQPREVTASTIDRGSLPLRKAIAWLDSRVRDLSERRPSAPHF